MPMTFWLCKELGTLAVDGENPEDVIHDKWCNAHQSYECVAEFAPIDKEWRHLRAENRRLETAARVIERAMNDAYWALVKAKKDIKEPRQSVVGLVEPLLPDAKEEDTET